jgi:hypothetical protein
MSMWIDMRDAGAVKVYETRPYDPAISKMTWVPHEGAWVLFDPWYPVPPHVPLPSHACDTQMSSTPPR